MTYQVIARKWRPQTFDELIGQEHISTTLKNAFKNDRVGHAFIFIGVRGVGKTTTARILAKRLNCDTPHDGNPCNKCKSCLDIQNGRHIDVIEIDGASNTGIEDVKAIREASKYLPSQGKYKIYIIDEVHMLSEKAFNALLKILEEPPTHIKFIFATTDPHKIPITIKSRCQIYDFRSISINDIFNHLKKVLATEDVKFEDDALYMISRKAQGSMRDAQSLLDQVISFASDYISKNDVINILGITSLEYLFETTDAIINHDIQSLILQTAQLVSSGINLVNYYKELLEHFHTILVVRNLTNPERILNLPAFELQKYKEQAAKFGNSFQKLYELLVLGFDSLKISQFKKITFEMNLIKLANFKPVTPLKDILSLLDKLSNSIEDNKELGEIKIDIFNHYKAPALPINTSTSDRENINTLATISKQKEIDTPAILNNQEEILIPKKNENKKDENIKKIESVVDNSFDEIEKFKKENPVGLVSTQNEFLNKGQGATIPIQKIHDSISSTMGLDPLPENGDLDFLNNGQGSAMPDINSLDTNHKELLNVIDYKNLVEPFYKNHDSMYGYFFGQTKIPVTFKENTFHMILPMTGAHMRDLNPKFEKEFLIWLKTNFGKDTKLEIKCERISDSETYEGIIENNKKEADKAEVNSIKNLPNVKKIEEMFKMNIRNITR